MYLVPIAWLYVALMMAVAEATNPIGTVFGALVTFVFYGLAPAALSLYLIGTPGRRRAAKAREAAQLARQRAAAAPAASNEPDAGGQAATDVVAPVREEP